MILKKMIEIEIGIDENDSTICKDCKYYNNEDFIPSCNMYGEYMEYVDNEIYSRCQSCIETFGMPE